MALRNITLVRANGNLGHPILQALLLTGPFRVSVLQRASSTSAPAQTEGIRFIKVPDPWTVDALAAALRGEDALVVYFPLADLAAHLALCDAAAAAGVRRVIPADFGSADSRSARAQELVRLFGKKVQVRERLQQLAAAKADFTWTSIVSGHFFDYGLEQNFLHFDLAKRKAEILGEGGQRSSLSTLARIAEAVVRVLERPEDTANRLLFVQSFCASQNEVLKSLEKATDAEWVKEYLDTEEFIAVNKAKADDGDRDAVENLVFALGVIDADWEKRPEFAMELLGFADEDLDDAVSKVVASYRVP